MKMLIARKQTSPETLAVGGLFANKKNCVARCAEQVRPENKEKYPKYFEFHQLFLRAQMSCLSKTDCPSFAVCRQAQMYRAIAEFPLDEPSARRCKEVCSKNHECANLLVPRVFMGEFEKLPLDKQAEYVKRYGDRDRCLFSCRYSSIRKDLDLKKMSSTIDENWEDMQPFFHCLAHGDCAQYTKCVTSQISSGSI